MAGVAAAPLLMPAIGFAAGRPRYRKRRKSPAPAPELQLFGQDGPPTLAQVHRFIDRLWPRLRRQLAQGRGKPSWREADLLAGLALRYGRPEVLAALLAASAGQPAWQPRREKWVQPSGAWQRRWAGAATLTWSWYDGGVLTRSALPLKLPA